MWEVKEITGFDVGVDCAFYLTGPVVGAEIISHTDVDDLGPIDGAEKTKDEIQGLNKPLTLSNLVLVPIVVADDDDFGVRCDPHIG